MPELGKGQPHRQCKIAADLLRRLLSATGLLFHHPEWFAINRTTEANSVIVAPSHRMF